jgi:hypothetical protein
VPRSIRFPVPVWKQLEVRAKSKGLSLRSALRAAVLDWARRVPSLCSTRERQRQSGAISWPEPGGGRRKNPEPGGTGRGLNRASMLGKQRVIADLAFTADSVQIPFPAPPNPLIRQGVFIVPSGKGSAGSVFAREHGVFRRRPGKPFSYLASARKHASYPATSPGSPYVSREIAS